MTDRQVNSSEWTHQKFIMQTISVFFINLHILISIMSKFDIDWSIMSKV